jgi:hypothetical protein
VTAELRSDSVLDVKARERVGRGAISASEQAYISLFFSVNDSPAQVLRVMEWGSEHQRLAFRQSGRSLFAAIALLFLGWLGFLFDALAEYDSFVFGYAGLVCWLSALVLHRSVGQRRARLLSGVARVRRWLVVPLLLLVGAGCVGLAVCISVDATSQLLPWASLVAFSSVLLVWEGSKRTRVGSSESPFDSRFDEARQLFAALKDDLPRNYPLLGWLDLTGLGELKLSRRDQALNGAPLILYRDEWLRLKLKLWDGNIMRISAVECVRRKEGFWKRGARKAKWKPGLTTARHQLKISVVVDATTHFIRRPQAQQRFEQGWIDTEVATDDRLVMAAFADARPTARQLLGMMKLAYDHVSPRAA